MSIYHSVTREEIKSQCENCGAHNGWHKIYCLASGFGESK